MAVESISHTTEAKTEDRSRFLRRVLQGNAIFSTASGLLFLLGSEAVAGLLGLPGAADIIILLSIGLFAWAGLTLYIASRPSPPRFLVFTIIAGDLLWVLGSIVLLLGGWLPLSTAGMWAIAFVADIVAVFAVLQYVGWRRMIA